MLNRRLKSLAKGLIGITFLWTGALYAQDYTTGIIDGIVQDEGGHPIAGATVVVDSNFGVHRTGATDDKGYFRAPRLPIGQYSVSVSADGYVDLADQTVHVYIGGSAAFTFTLESLAGVMEEVTVIGTRRGAWDFASTATGISVDVVELAENFPVQRNLTDIAWFAPGTTPGDEAFGNLASFSGGSVAENAYYVNGMNVTNFRWSRGSSVVPFEFYEQVEVKTGGYQAEFGRSIGGLTNSVTKSGSNKLHGGIYVVYEPEFLRAGRKDIEPENRWKSLDEEDNFELIGELSGPIIKDRLFFYALYNMRHNRAERVWSFEKRYVIDNDPFWGAKIDFVPWDGHHFEATFWSDETTVTRTHYEFNLDGLPRDEVDGTEEEELIGKSFFDSGGRNEIYRYTGVFSDWFTLSALYGKNRFEETERTPNDGFPVIVERVTNAFNTIPIGNWTSEGVARAHDTRTAWRVDADFYFDLMGGHHVRTGADREDLTALDSWSYSGGEYWRYQMCRNPRGCFGGQLAEGDEFVFHEVYDSFGTFETTQTAAYIQDSWEFLDNWRLNVGLRNETFDNRNALGETFIKADRQLAPRLGLIWDPHGDGSQRVTAFYGRYYMPIAAMVNILMAGAFSGSNEFLRHNGFEARDPVTDLPTGVDYDNPLRTTAYGDGTVGDPSTIKDQTVDPMYLDEFILGYEHLFANQVTVGVRAMYRELGRVIEDIGINPAMVAWAVENGYAYDDVSWIINPALAPINYVLGNPGTGMRVATDWLTDDGSLVWMDLTAEQLGYPKPKREYKALEFTFSRPFDGVWELDGSYTWSTVRGNTEGMVKSDTGNGWPGFTGDWDLVGVMLNADGPLPTENEHRLKLWGSWQPLNWLRIGGRYTLQSPRKFGCRGVLPDGTFDDPLRNEWEGRYNIIYWFCGGQPTPRGSQLEADWLSNLDLSFTLLPDFGNALPGQFQLRLDVFNVFKSSAVNDLVERGEQYVGPGQGIQNPYYGAPTAYQTPRRVSLLAQWRF